MRIFSKDEDEKVNMDEVCWISKDIDKNRFVEEIVTDCISKRHFSKQIYGEETAIRSSVICGIVDELSNAEADVRVVQIAVDECGSFSEMTERILARCFDDDKFSSDDTLVERKDFEGISDKGVLNHQIHRLLDDFDLDNIFLLIIFENFEKSKLYWSPTDYWWMRRTISFYQNLSVVMSSDCIVSEIIEASPLSIWQLFDDLDA